VGSTGSGLTNAGLVRRSSSGSDETDEDTALLPPAYCTFRLKVAAAPFRTWTERASSTRTRRC
jgi:hypothetical protein